jgi:hypothetical protein
VVGLDDEAVGDGVGGDVGGLAVSDAPIEDHSGEGEEDLLLDNSGEGSGAVLFARRDEEGKEEDE